MNKNGEGYGSKGRVRISGREGRRSPKKGADTMRHSRWYSLAPKIRENVRRLFQPIPYCNYIEHLTTLVGKTPKAKVVLYCRVSSITQQGHLQQYTSQRKYIEALNFDVVKVISDVSSGKDLNRIKLMHASAIAKYHDAILVGCSADRFLRSEYWHHKSNREALPVRSEVDQFLDIIDGVPIATIADPSLNNRQITSLQTRLGLETCKKQIGRRHKVLPGHKKSIRIRYKPLVIKLHREGKSGRYISLYLEGEHEVKVSKSTVHRWTVAD